MSNASNPVVTVRADDFDPIVAYENYTAWQTPDPQDHPTWYNESSSVTGVPWYEGEQGVLQSTALTTSNVSQHHVKDLCNLQFH